MVPAYVNAQPSKRYLSLAEREDIFAGVQRGDSIRLIAKSINRAASTVLRELRRNMEHQYRTRSRLTSRSGAKRIHPWDYRPSLAQQHADSRASRPKPAKLLSNPLLREVVQAKLMEKLSPEQARVLRKPRRKRNQRLGRIAGMVNISERPPEVEDRAVPGHWEGDLLVGQNSRSAIGTLVERSTRYVMLLHLPGGQGAVEVQEAMIAATKRLPQTMWKSLTWDQGREMCNHPQIRIATGLDIYFCDPGKPWQRGSNENTNGLLRQYFPKGTDLSGHHPDYLEFVAAQMNRRPRKTLGWLNPAEALDRLLSKASAQAGVATTA